MIPIGKLLRKRARTENEAVRPKEKVSLSNIDEIISKLETGSQDSVDSDSDLQGKEISTEIIEERDESGRIVRLASTNCNDIIAPLPAHLLPIPLPKPKTQREKKIGAGVEGKVVKFNDEIEPLPVARKKMKQEPVPDISSNPPQQSGLEATIKEILKHYEPSSADRKPFWCRICRFQGENVDQWNEHMSSDEHRVAAKIERKMSACRLCRKEFTSPEQLKEHMKGKAHKLAMENAKSKQELARKFR